MKTGTPEHSGLRITKNKTRKQKNKRNSPKGWLIDKCVFNESLPSNFLFILYNNNGIG